MSRLMGLSILAAVASPLAPAQAADVTTIGCVAEAVSPDGRGALDTYIARFIRSAPDEQLKHPPELLRAFGEALASCTQRHGWSTEAALQASMMAMAQLAEPTAARILREQGVNVEGLKSLYGALPRQLREADEMQVFLTAPALEDAMANAMARGYFASDQARAVGRYLAYLYAVDSCRVRFARM